MVFIENNWMLILLALTSGAMLLWPVINSAPAMGSVSTADAVNLINREKAVLIDVSDASEFALSHAGGAKNLPLADFEAKLSTLVKDKALPVLLMCPAGARAKKAAAIAKKLGFERASAVAGGTNGWRSASLPIEKAA